MRTVRKILIYCGHPAQYHFFKNSIINLERKSIETLLAIKTKDILVDLVKADRKEYVNILPRGRKSSRLGIAMGLLTRFIRMVVVLSRYRPDLVVGADPGVAWASYFLRIPHISAFEDDESIIKELAVLTFPITSTILIPTSCNVFSYTDKVVKYKGYMKLAYLHPDYFSQVKFFKDNNPESVLIRVSGLDAFHDFGKLGLEEDILDQIIRLLIPRFCVQISSEKPISSKYDEYILEINPENIHRTLEKSTLLISDSQSMSMEAAMLGIPSVRYNDFAGKIGVLNELESVYGLTFGVNTNNPDQLVSIISNLIGIPSLRIEFQKRRKIMLLDKINVTNFLTWFLSDYPKSHNTMRVDPAVQNKFLKQSI